LKWKAFLFFVIENEKLVTESPTAVIGWNAQRRMKKKIEEVNE